MNSRKRLKCKVAAKIFKVEFRVFGFLYSKYVSAKLMPYLGFRAGVCFIALKRPAVENPQSDAYKIVKYAERAATLISNDVCYRYHHMSYEQAYKLFMEFIERGMKK